MRVEILQAIGLIAALHAAGPFLSPTSLDPGELAGHLGERVTLVGQVVDVSPGETVSRVRVAGQQGTALALVDGALPPLGATVRVTGDAAAGDEGPLVWVDGPVDVLERPDRAPVALGVLAAKAPQRVGQTVAVVATWSPTAGTLVAGETELDARVTAAEPPAGSPIVAWGMLRYEPGEARYRIDVVGWEAWTPSAG